MESLRVDPDVFDNENYNSENIQEILQDNLRLRRKKKKKKRKLLKKVSLRPKVVRKRAKKRRKKVFSKVKTGVKKIKKKRILRKAGKGIKRAAKKTGKGLKKAGKTIKKVAQKLNPIWAPLVPLKGVMLKALEKKGKKVSRKSPIGTIAKTFYNEVVTKHYEALDEIHFDEELEPSHLTDAAISGIVKGVIAFIKALKKKKETKGEKSLTKTEKTIVSGTEKVELELKGAAKAEAAQTLGEKILFDKKTQYMGIGIAGIILLLLLSGSKGIKPKK